MRRIALVLSLLMVAPTLSLAQRGGRTRSGATSRTNMFPNDQMRSRGATVTSSKLRDLDPLAILVDKHEDLALTDSQVTALRTMDDQLGTLQKPAYHVLDSLDRELRNVGADPTSGGQQQMQTMNTLVRMIAGHVREQYDSVEKAAGALMTDAQKHKADDVLKDSHDQMGRLTARGRNR